MPRCYHTGMEQELITAEEYENSPSKEEELEHQRLMEIHTQMVAQRDDILPLLPRRRSGGLDRKRAMQNIADAFELIGGTTRLAIWAHDNEAEFFTKLYPKLLPSTSVSLTQNNNTVIRHVIPRGPLDE
jgi:hypothetical protein